MQSKRIIVLVLFTILSLNINAQKNIFNKNKKHVVYFSMGTGFDNYKDDKLIGIKKLYHMPSELSYQFFYNKNFSIGLLFTCENRDLDSSSILNILDLSYPNEINNLKVSSKMYFSSGYMGPLFSYKIENKKSVFFGEIAFSTGLLMTSKHSINLFSKPYDTTLYTIKYIDIYGQKHWSYGWYGHFSFKLGISLFEPFKAYITYSPNFNYVNIPSVYSYLTDRMAQPITINYTDKIFSIRHYFGLGIRLEIPK